MGTSMKNNKDCQRTHPYLEAAKWALAIAGFTFVVSCASAEPERDDLRPNILLVVADDLGFTDIGAYGGEIQTPNLDALASGGVRLTDFHVGATCSPTRAMLMSGVDSHPAGLGNMAEHMAPNQQQQPGYEGALSNRVVSVATLMKDAGYKTYIAGKWHLGMGREHAPDKRGFERSFVLLQGGASHFSDMRGLLPQVPHGLYRDSGEPVDALPDDFYSSKFYADKIIEYIDADRDKGKPFFAYLAFTAPHWPLQAPAKDIARYRGKYDEGYDVLQVRRLTEAQRKGVISSSVRPTVSETAPPWDSLSAEEKRRKAKEMEIYAAMVDGVDQHLGRVLQYLEDIGEYENTVVVFMSDNGTEGANRGKLPGLDKWLETELDNSHENLGRENSYVWYGRGWAEAGSAPYKMYKSYVSEGGIRSPAIISYPKSPLNGAINHSFTSVLDVAPTLLELAGTSHPDRSYQGREVQPLKGKSLMPLITGQSQTIHEDDYVMGWELFDHRAIRKGPWKLLYLSSAPAWLDNPEDSDRWALYNLNDDPGEKIDLSLEKVDLFTEMLGLWDEYAKENGVILPVWGKNHDGH